MIRNFLILDDFKKEKYEDILTHEEQISHRTWNHEHEFTLKILKEKYEKKKERQSTQMSPRLLESWLCSKWKTTKLFCWLCVDKTLCETKTSPYS